MIRVKILTTEKEFTNLDCEMVIIPGCGGEYGFLENHIDVVSKLEAGEVRLYTGEKVIERCFVYGGFASFQNNELNIMADNVQFISELNLKYAKEKFEFYSEEQNTADQDNEHILFDKVLLYRKMLEVGQKG